MTFVFLASQVEDFTDADGLGSLPTIKTKEGKWDTRGHRDRIVSVDIDALSAIHSLTEGERVPVEEARFIQPYSAKMLDVFQAMAAAPSLSEAVKPIKIWQPTPEGEREVEIPGWQMNRSGTKQMHKKF